MKKPVWLVLCIAIIAVILITVFASQRNSALDQVKEINAQIEDRDNQIEELKIATETATQLQRTVQAESEEKVKQAEEAKEKAESETTAANQRVLDLEGQVSQQQATIDTTVEQLRGMNQQIQEAISAITGEDEDATLKMLAETQEELSTLKADYEQVTADLLAAQEQLTTLRAAMDGAEAAKLAKTVVRIYNASDRLVTEFEDLSKLEEKNLAEGVYTLDVTLLNPADEEIAHYALPYVIASPAEDAPAPDETEPAPEAEGAEATPAETESAPDESAEDLTEEETEAPAPEQPEAPENEADEAA